MAAADSAFPPALLLRLEKRPPSENKCFATYPSANNCAKNKSTACLHAWLRAANRPHSTR